ncbi:hypothetical protein EYF80_009191 [Liparis tanakae]|uniref:Uncharacterized protein n=1 Tax=Liparis tanakae TaxID=230148 RepID=A0A4Z2IT20_9TELE|nr:hypothetical protein EYF80_009191 [Liparis tanakae]
MECDWKGCRSSVNFHSHKTSPLYRPRVVGALGSSLNGHSVLAAWRPSLHHGLIPTLRVSPLPRWTSAWELTRSERRGHEDDGGPNKIRRRKHAAVEPFPGEEKTDVENNIGKGESVNGEVTDEAARLAAGPGSGSHTTSSPMETKTFHMALDLKPNPQRETCWVRLLLPLPCRPHHTAQWDRTDEEPLCQGMYNGIFGYSPQRLEPVKLQGLISEIHGGKGDERVCGREQDNRLSVSCIKPIWAQRYELVGVGQLHLVLPPIRSRERRAQWSREPRDGGEELCNWISIYSHINVMCLFPRQRSQTQTERWTWCVQTYAVLFVRTSLGPESSWASGSVQPTVDRSRTSFKQQWESSPLDARQCRLGVARYSRPRTYRWAQERGGRLRGTRTGPKRASPSAPAAVEVF